MAVPPAAEPPGDAALRGAEAASGHLRSKVGTAEAGTPWSSPFLVIQGSRAQLSSMVFLIQST